MKHLKINKKAKLKGIRKLKIDIKEIVHDCLVDIEPYIVDDLMRYFKKRGMVYEKDKKKNKKKKTNKK